MSEFSPTNKTVNDVIDLDLSITKRKRFRIDGDDNRILELNTSDMTILNRVSEDLPKLRDLEERARNLMNGVEIPDDLDENIEETEDAIGTVAERLKAVDTEMRQLVDHIFNSNVSEITAPDGSMYDPFGGSFRYEHIITLLIGQFENNMAAEFKKMEKQSKKHTAKYTKG